MNDFLPVAEKTDTAPVAAGKYLQIFLKIMTEDVHETCGGEALSITGTRLA